MERSSKQGRGVREATVLRLLSLREKSKTTQERRFQVLMVVSNAIVFSVCGGVLLQLIQNVAEEQRHARDAVSDERKHRRDSAEAAFQATQSYLFHAMQRCIEDQATPRNLKG